MEMVLWQVFKEWGVSGAVVAFLVWAHFLRPWQKKRSGDWIETSDIIKNQKDIMELKSIINGHLEKEALEDIRFANMELNQSHLKEGHVEMKSDIKDIFKILSEIKNMMISMKK